MALVKEVEHLKISLDVIKLATNSFGTENLIGVGGFGKVYEGKILDADGRTKTVAIKRLDGSNGQGEREFLMEITMLSRYRHKNLVCLVGFCDEEEEKILIYEHELNGSLEKYLDSKALTWVQRLKICIGAARGMEYLHNPLETQQRVLHRDVKSSNVLLDQFWEAKISDFGLSKIGPANQEFTFIVSTAVGTLGYCDPLYAETGILTKESDVYSFGVVLFEVLCGRLCIVKNNGKQRLLTRLAQRNYEQGTIDEIIFDGLREQMEPNSLKTFSTIAYRCVKREREERPTMADVLGELELAYEYQESYNSGKPMEYEEILQMADREQPIVYTNRRELKLLLSSGILLDWGRRWFSLSESEHNCEMISASEFSFQDPETIDWIPDPKSRFSEVAKFDRGQGLNIDVDIETVLLSSGITYAAYLVFKYYNDSDVDEEADLSPEPIFVGLHYKIKEDGESYVSDLADHTDNGWLVIELCQFVSYKKTANLNVFLEGISDYNSIVLEGIQFLPVENAKNDESIQTENAYTKVTNGEQKLPSDYRHIIKMAKDHVPYNITNKELYLLLSNGILINKGQAFFYLDRDGVKCCMLAASSVLKDIDLLWISVRESRFEKVAEFQSGNDFRINCHINSHILSPNTIYSTYLVYKLPQDTHASGTFERPLVVKDSDRYSLEDNSPHFIFLSNPKMPVINVIKDDQRREGNPLNRPKVERVPKQRKDGWMEAPMWAFTTDAATTTMYKQFDVSFCDYHQKLSGLIVQGIEIRPK